MKKNYYIDLSEDGKWFTFSHDCDEEMVIFYKRRDTFPAIWGKPVKNQWNCYLGSFKEKDLNQIRQLNKWNIILSDKAQSVFERRNQEKQNIKNAYDYENVETKIDGLKVDLYPYQSAGVRFMNNTVDIENKIGMLNADVMGLGKTIEFIAHLLHMRKKLGKDVKALVVCPANSKYNWKQEVNKVSNLNCVVLNSQSKDYKWNLAIVSDIVVVNYDITWRQFEKIKLLATDRIICLDEAHHIKNWETKKSKGTIALTVFGMYTIAMTGTPIVNRPKELWMILQAINRSWYKHRTAYLRKYCPGSNASGADNLDELRSNLSPFMLRRLKSEVDIELPSKRWISTFVELDNRKEYDYAEKNFIDWVERRFGKESAGRAILAEAIVKMNRLRFLSSSGKYSPVKDFIEECLNNEEPIVTFSCHRDILFRLKDYFKDKACLVVGGVSSKKRHRFKNQFQDGKYQIFLASTRAAKESLTLTRARISAFVDFPWTPGSMVQASDRIHRIGQDRSCEIYKFVSKGIDEKMDSLISDKIDVIDTVMGDKGKEGSLSNESVAGDLVKLYGGDLEYEHDLEIKTQIDQDRWLNW